MKNNARLAIETAWRLGSKCEDWNLAWFVLRDLEAVNLAGLSDLAWSGHKQGDVTKSDFKGFVEMLEQWLTDGKWPNDAGELRLPDSDARKENR